MYCLHDQIIVYIFKLLKVTVDHLQTSLRYKLLGLRIGNVNFLESILIVEHKSPSHIQYDSYLLESISTCTKNKQERRNTSKLVTLLLFIMQMTTFSQDTDSVKRKLKISFILSCFK